MQYKKTPLHTYSVTVMMIVLQCFLIKFLSLLPRCQLSLTDVVYPYIFFLFCLFPGQQGKDLNLFFLTEFTSSAHFCGVLTKRIIMKGRVRYLQGYKKTWRQERMQPLMARNFHKSTIRLEF